MGQGLRLDLNNPRDVELARRSMKPAEFSDMMAKHEMAPEIAEIAPIATPGRRAKKISGAISDSQVSPSGSPGKGKNKYGNTKFERDGFKWDSEWEYQAWLMLQELQRRGLIFDLRRQRTFVFWHRGIGLTSYRADYTFDLRAKAAFEPRFDVGCPQCGESKSGALNTMGPGGVFICKCPVCENEFPWEMRLPDVVGDAKSEYVAGFAKFHVQQNMMLAFYRKRIEVFIKEQGPAGVEHAVKKLVDKERHRVYDDSTSAIGRQPVAS